MFWVVSKRNIGKYQYGVCSEQKLVKKNVNRRREKNNETTNYLFWAVVKIDLSGLNQTFRELREIHIWWRFVVNQSGQR